MNVDNHAIQPPRPSKLKKILWLGASGLRFLTLWTAQYLTLKSNDSVKRYQYRRLKRLIKYAWVKVPFYRQYWSEAGFNPSMFKSLEDMSLIPVIDKNTILAHRDEFLAQGVNMSRLELITTGGTTGMPMEFYIDNYRARAKEQAHQMYAAYHVWGYRQYIDRCISLRGARIDDNLLSQGIFWQKSDRDRGYVMSSFHLLEENYQAYIDKIRAYRPRFIRAYPSSIVALCLLMKKHGDHGFERLKGVLCSSENIYDWQRALVMDVLGVPIHSSYGHTEKAVWSFEHDGHLLFPPRYGYAEFVDDDLNPVNTPGSQAQIIATGYDLDAFPFIRYKTDDIAIVGASVEGYPQVADRIVGRRQEFVIDRYGNKVPFTCSDEVFWGLRGIDAYQYVQSTPGVMDINIQTSDDFDPATIETIKGSAREIFLNFDITVNQVPDIPKTKSGKFRYLIQNISE